MYQEGIQQALAVLEQQQDPWQVAGNIWPAG